MANSLREHVGLSKFRKSTLLESASAEPAIVPHFIIVTDNQFTRLCIKSTQLRETEINGNTQIGWQLTNIIKAAAKIRSC